jgi:CelD/BcsL family acetyltransferase involved in cellulose biosynthesis
MDVTAHEGMDALEALKPEWDELLRSCGMPRPFLTHEWLTASWRHYAERDRLVTACVRDGGRLVGLVPLRVKRSKGASQLWFAVVQADCPDFLIGAGAEWSVLEAFFGWLQQEYTDWDLMRLRGICCRSATDHLLPILAREAGLVSCAWRADATPYVVLPSTREEYYAQMPARGRLSGFLRKRRRLVEDHGEFAVRVTAGADLTRDAMARCLELHRRSWEGRGGSQVVTDPRVAQFHTDIATALAPKGMSQVLWVTVGGREVASYYGFSVGSAWLAYMLGHDPDFAQYSPGAQMTLTLIEYGIDQGWQEVDLMRGAERYKFDYTHRCAYTMEHAIAKSRSALRLFTTVAAFRGRLMG